MLKTEDERALSNLVSYARRTTIFYHYSPELCFQRPFRAFQRKGRDKILALYPTSVRDSLARLDIGEFISFPNQPRPHEALRAYSMGKIEGKMNIYIYLECDDSVQQARRSFHNKGRKPLLRYCHPSSTIFSGTMVKRGVFRLGAWRFGVLAEQTDQ